MGMEALLPSIEYRVHLRHFQSVCNLFTRSLALKGEIFSPYQMEYHNSQDKAEFMKA